MKGNEQNIYNQSYFLLVSVWETYVQLDKVFPDLGTRLEFWGYAMCASEHLFDAVVYFRHTMVLGEGGTGVDSLTH